MSQQGRTRSGSVVFPLLLIALGTLFLLWRWLPDFDPFPVLWKYWPLFLILVGAGMFWDRMQRHRDPQTAPSFPVGSMIGTLLFLIVLTFLLWHHHSTHRLHWTNWDTVSTGSSSHDTKTVNLQGAKAVHMNLEMPAGELRLEGGAQHLLEAEFYRSGSWGAPEVDYTVENGVGSLTINQEKGMPDRLELGQHLEPEGERHHAHRTQSGCGRRQRRISSRQSEFNAPGTEYRRRPSQCRPHRRARQGPPR